MSVAVKLSDELVNRARTEGAACGRTTAEQIEFWDELLRAIMAHPDVPIEFLKDTVEVMLDGTTPEPYEFEAPQENDSPTKEPLRKSG